MKLQNAACTVSRVVVPEGRRTQEINRVRKLLELGNIKLAAVATDVLGKSGRATMTRRR
jgi:hypothetical protein